MADPIVPPVTPSFTSGSTDYQANPIRPPLTPLYEPAVNPKPRDSTDYQQADPKSDEFARRAPLTRQEKAVFGEDARRGADGKVIETGVGSPEENHFENAHVAAVELLAAADGIAVAAKAVADDAAKLATSAKEGTKNSSRSLDASRKRHEVLHKELAESKKSLKASQDDLENAKKEIADLKKAK
jgi:hypothetical protein